MQEAVVIKFAELLGKESKVGTEPDLSSARSMKGLFSRDVGEQEIVLVLPSLEIQLSENNGGGPLPDVGESRMNHRSGNNDMHDPATDGLAPPLPRKPTMTASVLTSAAKDAANAELEVAKSLEENSAWTKSTVGFAPSALVNNLSQSFSRLVGSRMKAWTLLLLRHSLSTGDESSRKRLLGILTAILKVESVATQFTTLSLPDSAKVHEKEADVILPLLFGATVTVTGQDGKKDDPVTVRAPGAISANFATGCALKDVKIQLDCSALMNSMVEQARILVLKAVATATKTSVPSAAPQPLPGYNPGSHQLNQQQLNGADGRAGGPPPNLALPPKSSLSASKSLASFRSAMSLTSTSFNKSPRLLKAQCSALRLNNILQGNKDEAADGTSSSNKSTLGMRKVRSVKWNTPGELPNLAKDVVEDHSPKKARSMHVHAAVAKLKSFKSFGRPHAGDFGAGPRNATFGEFGGRSSGMWGRDGRMVVHPTPMKDATLRDPLSGEFQGHDRNATFNLAAAAAAAANKRNRPSIHLASCDGPAPSSSIPRTATVLETLLLKRSMT